MRVNFRSKKVMTVTEVAITAKNPAFIPIIVKINDVNSCGLPTCEMCVRSILSGDAKRGTLRIAFARNRKNRDAETVFT